VIRLAEGTGASGDDALTGGGGDLLKGEAGNDRFVDTALSDSAVSGAGKDTVADFSTGDRIDLSGIDADGNSSNGDTAFTFGTGGFTGHAGEVRVLTSGAIQLCIPMSTATSWWTSPSTSRPSMP